MCDMRMDMRLCPLRFSVPLLFLARALLGRFDRETDRSSAVGNFWMGITQQGSNNREHPDCFFVFFLFSANRQIPGLATGAVGYSLFVPFEFFASEVPENILGFL